MPIRVVCKKCGKTLQTSDAAAGKRGKCPKCGESFVVPAAGGESSPEAGRSRRRRPSQDGQSAEDSGAGQARRRRRRAPDDDAPERRRRRKRSSADEPSPHDMDNLFAGLGAGAEMGPEVDDPSDTNREPCPACGGMIKRNAAKCRFCGEIFDSVLRNKRSGRRASDPDENLQPGDWVAGILCGCIACVIGIIWMVQGKPKGWKMLALATAAQFFWWVIGVILQIVLFSL